MSHGVAWRTLDRPQGSPDQMHEDFIIFSGTASSRLGGHVARLLDRHPGACVIQRFPDGEVNVQLEETVRGREVYLVQSTCPPVDEHLIELLAIADACRRASASRITAVVPYFGYARADKRNGRRAPVTGRMVASLMESVGIQHLLTVDLHAAQTEGFFQIPVDCVTAVPALCQAVQKSLEEGTVVVSPDEGRVKMATMYARRLALPLVVLHKERRNGGSTRITHVVGEVRDRPCLITDDMISTGGTILDAIDALLKGGARPGITVAATHGLFVGEARDYLSHPAIREIVITDSVPFTQPDWEQVKVISLAPLLAAAIGRFRTDDSIGDLYDHVIHEGISAVKYQI